jgi:hypothetical protein
MSWLIETPFRGSRVVYWATPASERYLASLAAVNAYARLAPLAVWPALFLLRDSRLAREGERRLRLEER